MTTAPRIDAHQHFWSLQRNDYGWLTPQMPALHHDFQPADLLPHLERHAIAGTVLVQAAPTVAETRYLLSLADQHSFIRGVVGWADLASSNACATIDELAAHPKLRALRPMLQDLPDDDWINSAPIEPALHRMAQRRLAFDALVKPRHLMHLHHRLQRHPELAVVIDHSAKPEIVDGKHVRWRADLAALAALPGVHCKLSGLLTEARPGSAAATLRPYVEAVLELFGPERVLWGSDWPVLNLAASYDDWIAITDELLQGLSATQREAVLGANAIRFYQLP